MNDIFKNKIVFFRKLYNINNTDIINFENEYNKNKKLNDKEIIESISITSKLEYEDDVSFKITKDTIDSYNKNILYNNKNIELRIVNLYEAYKYLNSIINKKLTIEIIMEIHNNIMYNFVNKLPGIFRKSSVYIGDGSIIREFIDHNNILNEINEFIRDYNKLNVMQNNYNLLKDICFLKKEFIRIHPFLDSNGRTSRILFQKLLIENNLPVVTFKNWIRDDYHDIMELSVETNRVNILTDFVLYNLYNDIKILDTNCNIIDTLGIEHNALKTEIEGVFFSIKSEQFIRGNIISNKLDWI